MRYDDGQDELLWFDLPAALADEVSTSATPWLAALLPLAVFLREPVRTDLPVDQVLLDGCRAVLDVWSAWYPDVTPIAIEAPVAPPLARTGPAGTGLFFSGGVDSFFTLHKRNGPGAPPAGRVTDLLLLHGADIPLADSNAFDRLRPRMAEVAAAFETGLIDIATNLRTTRWRRVDYPQLSHVTLLVAAGLLLESRLARLYVASSAPYWRLQPYGSHPITDPLFSTSRTRIHHDGAEQDRPAKVAAIANHPAVLKHLRVCWIGRSDTNCGRCPKCFNTMLGLELAGTLERSETLPRQIDPAVLGKVYFSTQGTYPASNVLRVYRRDAFLAGRMDLVRLLDRVLARSDRLRFAKDVIEGLARRRLIPARLGSRLVERLFRSSVKY